MIKQMLEEIHVMPLDDRGRERLTSQYRRTVTELEEALPPGTARRVAEVTPPLRTGTAVSDAELRVAQAQLVGWLEGLFGGCSSRQRVQNLERA